MRVIGIDPGTVSIDVCGLEGDRVFLDRSIATRDAVSDPETFVAMLDAAGPVDCVVGPSGYGMPVTRGEDVTEEALRMAFLAAPGERGGIGGLTALARRLAAASSAARPVVFIPGVVHLASVPAYRKVNRVDLGTADKVCATVLAIAVQMARRGCRLDEVSLILVEMGGAFTAGVAVSGGRIVDGIGGSAGPMGFRAGGAWDGEVAVLADHVTKGMVFSGGVVSAWGDAPTSEGWDAFVEGVVKLVATLMVSVPAPAEIVLSGRLAFTEPVYGRCVTRLSRVARVERLVGQTAARGAALIGDGLVGGARRELVEWLGIPTASGSVLDHLVVITPAAARARLGLA